MPLAAWRENSSRHVASLRRIRLLFFIAPVSSTITGRDYPQWTDLRKYVAELPVTRKRSAPAPFSTSHARISSGVFLLICSATFELEPTEMNIRLPSLENT